MSAFRRRSHGQSRYRERARRPRLEREGRAESWPPSTQRAWLAGRARLAADKAERSREAGGTSGERWAALLSGATRERCREPSGKKRGVGLVVRSMVRRFCAWFLGSGIFCEFREIRMKMFGLD